MKIPTILKLHTLGTVMYLLSNVSYDGINKKVAKLFKFDFVLTSHLAYSISLNISKR